MTSLGKSLVFCLKYSAEMKHLYWSGEPTDLRDLEDSERVVAMAQAIGEAASEEAAAFLRRCLETVGEILFTYGHDPQAKLVKPGRINGAWSFEARARRSSGDGGWFSWGVRIDERGFLAPWLWRDKARGWVEKARLHLGDRVAPRIDPPIFLTPNTLALAYIAVFNNDSIGYEVDADVLLGKVLKAFRDIHPDEWKAIAHGLTQEDESQTAQSDD